MRFKNFEIRQCTFLGDPPTPDYHKWNFDLVSGIRAGTERNTAIVSDTLNGTAKSSVLSLEVVERDTFNIVRTVLKNGCLSGAK